MMKKAVLANGLTIIYEHRKVPSVVVEVMIKVGSDSEAADEKGISHLIEHLLFEGTVKRPTNLQISNEIERVGGEFNAYTSNERTCFYVKVLKKHFQLGVDILSDIIQHPLFKESDIKKEKEVVIKEIGMVNDDPRFYQWVLLQKTLFKKHPAKNPTYGDKKVVRSFSREKILNYFNKHYSPKNIIISVVGDIKNWNTEIRKKFTFSGQSVLRRTAVLEPKETKNSFKKEKRKIANTYMVMGFKTVPKNNGDSYILDVINSILGRGQSGRMFTEIRGKRGLAYDVGTQNINEVGFGYFAIYASIDKKNTSLVKNLIIEEIKTLKAVSETDLKEAKDYLEGNYYLEREDTQRIADELLFWEHVKSASLMKEYIKRIKKVSAADIKKTIDKYFKYHTLVMIEGK